MLFVHNGLRRFCQAPLAPRLPCAGSVRDRRTQGLSTESFQLLLRLVAVSVMEFLKNSFSNVEEQIFRGACPGRSEKLGMTVYPSAVPALPLFSYQRRQLRLHPADQRLDPAPLWRDGPAVASDGDGHATGRRRVAARTGGLRRRGAGRARHHDGGAPI